MKKTMIITYPCNNLIHVLSEKSGVVPIFPYKLHKTIDDAKRYLKEIRGISNVVVIEK